MAQERERQVVVAPGSLDATLGRGARQCSTNSHCSWRRRQAPIALLWAAGPSHAMVAFCPPRSPQCAERLDLAVGVVGVGVVVEGK